MKLCSICFMYIGKEMIMFVSCFPIIFIFCMISSDHSVLQYAQGEVNICIMTRLFHLSDELAVIPVASHFKLYQCCFLLSNL